MDNAPSIPNRAGTKMDAAGTSLLVPGSLIRSTAMSQSQPEPKLAAAPQPPLVTDCTCAWRRSGPACTQCDRRVHRAAWRAPWPHRTMLARSSARFTEPGVGWRSSCAARDCGAIGPASGLLADWRTAFSNCAIAVVQGPACAETAHRSQAAPAITTINRRFMLSSNRWPPIANAVPSREAKAANCGRAATARPTRKRRHL